MQPGGCLALIGVVSVGLSSSPTWRQPSVDSVRRVGAYPVVGTWNGTGRAGRGSQVSSPVCTSHRLVPDASWRPQVRRRRDWDRDLSCAVPDASRRFLEEVHLSTESCSVGEARIVPIIVTARPQEETQALALPDDCNRSNRMQRKQQNVLVTGSWRCFLVYCILYRTSVLHICMSVTADTSPVAMVAPRERGWSVEGRGDRMEGKRHPGQTVGNCGVGGLDRGRTPTAC